MIRIKVKGSVLTVRFSSLDGPRLATDTMTRSESIDVPVNGPDHSWNGYNGVDARRGAGKPIGSVKRILEPA